MKHRLSALLPLLALTAFAYAGASVGVAAPVSSPAQAAKVSLVDVPTADLYSVYGTFDSPSAPQAVWDVLSDYPALAGVVKGLRSSKVLERDANGVLVEQVMEGHFLIFGRTLRLRLRVKEEPPRFMAFSEVAGGPFRSYQGSWSIAPTPAGARVDYTLNVSRGDLAPRFLERNLFEKNATDLLRDLSREVDRRAGLRGVSARIVAPRATPVPLETLENGVQAPAIKKSGV